MLVHGPIWPPEVRRRVCVAQRHELQRRVLALGSPCLLGTLSNLSKRHPIPRCELLTKEPAPALGREDDAAPEALVRPSACTGCAVRAHRGEARGRRRRAAVAAATARSGAVYALTSARACSAAKARRAYARAATAVARFGFGVTDDEGREGRTVDTRPGHAVWSAATSAAAGAKMGGRSRRVSAGKRPRAETTRVKPTWAPGDVMSAPHYPWAGDVLEVLERPDDRHEHGRPSSVKNPVGYAVRGGTRGVGCVKTDISATYAMFSPTKMEMVVVGSRSVCAYCFSGSTNTRKVTPPLRRFLFTITFARAGASPLPSHPAEDNTGPLHSGPFPSLPIPSMQPPAAVYEQNLGTC
ncbi:hypothetical protein FB451DRAFT_1527771 [Mycena latifolia]|nr:hypothetical protein FB451DRAFT_1527771 [Mycena latifolia]